MSALFNIDDVRTTQSMAFPSLLSTKVYTKKINITVTLVFRSHSNLFTIVSAHLQYNQGPLIEPKIPRSLGATREPTSAQHQNIQDLARNEKQRSSDIVNCIQGTARFVLCVQDSDWSAGPWLSTGRDKRPAAAENSNEPRATSNNQAKEPPPS